LFDNFDDNGLQLMKTPNLVYNHMQVWVMLPFTVQYSTYSALTVYLR